MKETKQKLCECGCGKPVRLVTHRFIHGHNIRETMKKPKWAANRKKAVIKKYGVENVQQIPSIKAKAVKTRREKYDHWFGNMPYDKIINICSKGGKRGGAKTAKRWKENPEEFKAFLEKGHAAQRLPGGHYDRMKTNNPMKRPEVKIKHRKAIIEGVNKPGVQERKIKTRIERYGSYNPNIPKKEKHYNWKGGISFKRYGKDWKDIRKFILIRDNYRCIICNTKKMVEVHHIIPISSGIDTYLLNEPLNLISLCKSHHQKHERTNCYEKEIIDYLNNWGKMIYEGRNL